MKDYVLSESFFICQDTAGDPLEGSAVPSEMACLVYDYKLGQLVDFHLFTVSEKWERAKIQKLFERFLLLAELNDGSVPRVLRHGRVDGMVFYTAALEEGEVLTDYVRRIGPLPEQVVLELIGELVTNLLRLQEWPQLFRSCSLEGARLIFSPQGLQDRRLVQIRNFGLNSSEVLEDEAAAEHHLAVEVARLIYLLLTGFVSPQRGGPMVGAVRLLDLSVPLRAFVESSFENDLQQLTLCRQRRRSWPHNLF